MQSKRVLVPIANGFEEIEAITVIDVLRRAGCEVVVAGVSADPIVATRGTRHQADRPLGEVLLWPFDAIVLPGGRPGADALAADEGLRQKIWEHFSGGTLTAAICAAPLALDAAGVLMGRKFTCHPSVVGDIRSGTHTGTRVEIDGHLMTGQAAGSAMEFALAIVRRLCGEDKLAEINRGLLARFD